MSPPLWCPKGKGKVFERFEVPEEIPPGYDLEMSKQAGL